MEGTQTFETPALTKNTTVDYEWEIKLFRIKPLKFGSLFIPASSTAFINKSSQHTVR
jgi:hypothetical protein